MTTMETTHLRIQMGPDQASILGAARQIALVDRVIERRKLRWWQFIRRWQVEHRLVDQMTPYHADRLRALTPGWHFYREYGGIPVFIIKED